MKEEPKTVETVEIEKQNGVRKAHEGGWATTDVEGAAKSAEKARIKTDERAAEKDKK